MNKLFTLHIHLVCVDNGENSGVVDVFIISIKKQSLSSDGKRKKNE